MIWTAYTFLCFSNSNIVDHSVKIMHISLRELCSVHLSVALTLLTLDEFMSHIAETMTRMVTNKASSRNLATWVWHHESSIESMQQLVTLFCK